jgi:hypothetical protein
VNPLPTSPFRSAIAAVFGNKPADPLQASRGNLHEATARRLGIKLADRPAVDPDTVPHLVNRAGRRAALRRSNPQAWRAGLASSYSRQLTTRKAAQ